MNRLKPQLLAPAGSIESFFAAMENGADAVYLGLKNLSARASAANFTLDELALLLPYARKRHISINVALNSVITAPEFPQTLDLLQSLSDLEVDALIVQDPGVFYLARRFFPALRLHASTLTAIHNLAGVRQLQRLGAHRVVLARELTLQEIQEIALNTPVELELFVHGALCYSYSGLCMASSFRGGHGGLQGRCVQPCRLRFRQGRKEGFYLSCNDLCALPLIPRLQKLPIAAFKIEGRMKPAETVAQVVKAYRMVMDAPPDREKEALAEAQELLAQSPSRRLSRGYLQDNYNDEILSPHRSGSSGLWIGTVKSAENDWANVALRRDIHPGDRLRPESMEGKEKTGFTVSKITTPEGEDLPMGRAETVACLFHDGKLRPGERLFRTGIKGKSFSGIWGKIRRESSPLPFSKAFRQREKLQEDQPEPPVTMRKVQETLIVKIGRIQDLSKALQSPADWVMLTATRSNMERLARQKLIPAHKKRFIWSLPPLIMEKECHAYRPAIDWYCKKGFHAWEVNNWGHFDFFSKEEKVRLMAGYRFNLRNAAALQSMAEAGCWWSILSLEITREELENLSRVPLGSLPIVTVYAWPPLFTSRLAPRLLEGKPFVTVRKETYFHRRYQGQSLVYADCPINWFEKIPALRGYGYRCFLIDMSDGPHEQSHHFEQVFSGFKRLRADMPYSIFNYDRRPVPDRNRTDTKGKEMLR